MWKNVFLESCILSALIFGGFYLNTSFLKNELYSDGNKDISNQSHVSGHKLPTSIAPLHISGKKTEEELKPHISGVVTQPDIQP